MRRFINTGHEDAEAEKRAPSQLLKWPGSIAALQKHLRDADLTTTTVYASMRVCREGLHPGCDDARALPHCAPVDSEKLAPRLSGELDVDLAVAAGREGLAARLTSGAGVVGIGFLLSRGLTFATYVVLAQLIVPRDAGQLAAGTILIGMGFVFAESGMLAALIHWPDDINEAASSATVSTVVTGLGLTALGVATSPLIGWFFQSSTVGWVAAAASGWIFLCSLQIVPDALLQRRFSFVRRAVIDPLGSLVHGITAITLCALGLGVWGLVLGVYALHLSRALAGWALLDWRPKRRLMSVATWRKLADYARHVVASEVVRRAAGQLDSILLGRFSGGSPLGQYTYGFRIAAIPIDAWVSVANYGLLPAFARIASDGVRLRRAFHAALAAMCILSLPIMLFLLIAGNRLAFLLLGPRWPQAGEAVRALAGLGFGQMLTSISSEVFKAAGRPQLLTRTHLFATCLGLVILPLLLWALPGVIGIGIGVSIVALLTGLLAVHQATGIVGGSLGGVAATLRGVALAGLIGGAVVWGVDVVTPADRGRAGAALACATDAIAMAVAYGAAARLLAPQHLGPLADAVRRTRPGRVKAVR